MTDTYIEEKITERFLNIGEPYITEPIEETDSEGNIWKTYPNVALPNEAFEVPANELFFEVFFMPGVPFQSELGTSGRNRCTGIFQININTPKDWGVNGTAKVNDCYDAIASAFRRGDIFDGVRIVKTYRSSARSSGDCYTVPVSVQWWAELEN